MIDVVTNTPRPGETAEQTAARTAARQTPPRAAKLAYLTQPLPGMFVLNLQFDGDLEASRIHISRAQLGNILVDGAAMAFRESAFIPPPPEPTSVEKGGLPRFGSKVER